MDSLNDILRQSNVDAMKKEEDEEKKKQAELEPVEGATTGLVLQKGDELVKTGIKRGINKIKQIGINKLNDMAGGDIKETINQQFNNVKNGISDKLNDVTSNLQNHFNNTLSSGSDMMSNVASSIEPLSNFAEDFNNVSNVVEDVSEFI